MIILRLREFWIFASGINSPPETEKSLPTGVAQVQIDPRWLCTQFVIADHRSIIRPRSTEL